MKILRAVNIIEQNIDNHMLVFACTKDIRNQLSEKDGENAK